MLHVHRVGDIKITGIVEYFGPTHDPRATFPDFDSAAFAEAKRMLPSTQYSAAIDRLIIAINLWVVQANGATVLIDAGVGNSKVRPSARMNMLNTLLPLWLAAAGAAPEQVTHVVITHLHSDHVGWCTTLVDGHWEPTFRAARHYFPRGDFAFFKDRAEGGLARETSFVDSVRPVVEAGLATYVDPGAEIADLLLAEDARGHTPGQLAYRLHSAGAEGLFCGDVFHSPLQILQPNWNTAFCIEPDFARRTRHAVLADAAARSTLLMPCHFGPPHCGRVTFHDGSYRFLPDLPE